MRRIYKLNIVYPPTLCQTGRVIGKFDRSRCREACYNKRIRIAKIRRDCPGNAETPFAALAPVRLVRDTVKERPDLTSVLHPS